MSLKRKFLKNSSRLLREGFTLLEVVIALAIMTVAFGSILAVQGGAINATARAKQMNIVSMLAKNKMVETEYLIQGKTFDEVPKDKSGSFEPPYEEFGWKTSIKKMEFPNLAAMISGGGGSKGSQDNQTAEMLTKLITNHLNKSMREVTVTVSWTQGTNQQTFDLSTFWVDLNHDFSLSE